MKPKPMFLAAPVAALATDDPVELIRQTLAVLETYGWHQGSYGSRGEGYCWLGARRLLGGAFMSMPDTEAYLAAIERLFPERRETIGLIMMDDKGYMIREQTEAYSIPGFNDHPDTTFEDVKLVAKHAIADLEAASVT